MRSQPHLTVLHPVRAEVLLFAWLRMARIRCTCRLCLLAAAALFYAPSGFDVMMRGAAAALEAPGPNGVWAQGMSAIARTSASCKQYAYNTCIRCSTRHAEVQKEHGSACASQSFVADVTPSPFAHFNRDVAAAAACSRQARVVVPMLRCSKQLLPMML